MTPPLKARFRASHKRELMTQRARPRESDGGLVETSLERETPERGNQEIVQAL